MLHVVTRSMRYLVALDSGGPIGRLHHISAVELPCHLLINDIRHRSRDEDITPQLQHLIYCNGFSCTGQTFSMLRYLQTEAQESCFDPAADGVSSTGCISICSRSQHAWGNPQLANSSTASQMEGRAPPGKLLRWPPKGGLAFKWRFSDRISMPAAL